MRALCRAHLPSHAADFPCARSAVAAAAAQGDDRHAAYFGYRLGEVVESENRYAAAEAAYEKSLQSLRRAGPPTAIDQARLAPEVYDLRPDIVLVARGLALKKKGNVAAAEASYVAVLDPTLCAGWPDSGFGKGQVRPPMQAVSNLVVIYEERGDASKRDARMRQWRELLVASGVGVPSDTDAWLEYELARLRSTRPASNAEPMDLLARAKRVYSGDDIRLCRYLRFCSNFMPSELAALTLERARAIARAPGNTSAYASRSEVLRTLLMLGRAHLRLPHGSPGPSTPAAKTAALRAYAQAAEMFVADDARSVEYAVLLDDIVKVSNDPVAQGIPEIRIQLPGGRMVSLHEPDGLGRIALSEEAMRIRTEALGVSDAALIAPMMAHGTLLNHHGDVMEAAAVMERVAKLAFNKLGGTHSTTVSARVQAKSAQDNLKLLQSTVVLDPPTKQLDRRTAQVAYLKLMQAGTFKERLGEQIGRREGESEADYRKRATEEGLDRARRAANQLQRHDPPCAGCGAVRDAAAPPFKLCAACKKVAYCTADCQKGHWKRAHKRECSTLAGTAK